MIKADECGVCYLCFSENKRPRNLPCGHTFCSVCVGDMIKDGELTCPTCRASHTATDVNQFPIGYSTEALVTCIKSYQYTVSKLVDEKVGPRPDGEDSEGGESEVEDAEGASAVSSGSDSESEESKSEGDKEPQAIGLSKCTKLGRKVGQLVEDEILNLVCLISGYREFETQLGEYQQSVARWKERHSSLTEHLIQLAQKNKKVIHRLNMEEDDIAKTQAEHKEKLTVLNDLLNGLRSDKVNKVLTALNSSEECIEDGRGWLYQGNEDFPLVNAVCETLEVQEKSQAVVKSMEESMDFTDLEKEVDAKNSIVEKLMLMESVLRQVRYSDLSPPTGRILKLLECGLVYAVQEDAGGVCSSKVTLNEGNVYLHCLRNQPPPHNAHRIPMSELLEVINSRTCWAFLDLAWNGETRGRLGITLSNDRPLARQFKLLCTGQRGHSYLNTKFLRVDHVYFAGENLVGGDYEFDSGNGGAMLVSEFQTEFLEVEHAGTVMAGWQGQEKASQFGITTRYSGGRHGNWGIGSVRDYCSLDLARRAVNQGDPQNVTIVECGVCLWNGK